MTTTRHWSIFNFGKYRGKQKTLPQIVFDDPDWFFWAKQAGVFRGRFASEAEHIARRACRIRIPQREDGVARLAEYYVDSQTRKFFGLSLVSELSYRDPGIIRSEFLDLSFARSAHPYDKSGSKRLARQVIEILFGSQSTRMTRTRAAEFFDNDDNFGLS